MPPHIRKYPVMKRIAKFLSCTLLLFVATACGKVRPVTEVPDIHVGEPTFFPTIVAHADAPIIGGNRIDILLNGDEVFPAMLRDIKSARQTITFAQYLYQDGKLAREFADALAERCRAGVKGHILLDSQGARDVKLTYRASRRNYGKMLQGGIEIYEYHPALMHAKTMIVDGVWATVGSTNMANRSFALNEELNLAVYDRAFARRLEDIFRDDLRYSRKITYVEWAARPWRERFFELFAFPFQEQL